jgi:hypothetical protein
VYTYGAMVNADVQIGGETASSVPVQLMGLQPDGWSPPSDANCEGSNAQYVSTVAAFGANGILGVGPFAEDCGTSCAGRAGTVIDTVYYGCASNVVGCSPEAPAALSAGQPLTNPVTMFLQDNNGLIIELPSIPLTGGTDVGAQTVTGQILFGIGTESNNALSTQTVVPADPTLGTIVTTYNGQPLTSSFLDTGANAYLFGNSSETSITQCPTTGSQSDPGYYCPTTADPLSATLSGATTNSATSAATPPPPVSFSIANAVTLNSASNAAFDNLGGLLPGSYSADASSMFVWGLPFFYGRDVVIAFAGYNTSAGNGPYYAF